MTHICVSNLTIIGSDNDLSPSRRQAIIWTIINGTLGNIFQWNLKQNVYILIQENACENLVCEMEAILSRPQCFKGWYWWTPGQMFR